MDCLASAPRTLCAQRTRLHAVCGLLLIVLSAHAAHAATTQFSYDTLGRLTQASQTNGSNLQYQYDANGNRLSTTLSNNATLTTSSPLNVNLTTPGQGAEFSFTAAGGQTLTININGISTSPPGSLVTASVYNSSGVLIASDIGSSSITLNLGNVPAGVYSIVVTVPSGVTAALQASMASSLTQSSNSTDGDAPLPVWALWLLGGGLLGVLRRFSRATRLAQRPF